MDPCIPMSGGQPDLLTHIQERAYDRFIPLNASIELTMRCNIRCVHCYNFDREAPLDRASAAAELSPAEVMRVMTELRDAGCLYLALTGGEALVHPNLFDFLDHARKLHLAVQVLTNGTLLTEEMAARLAGYPNLLGVSLSLYGATAAVHDGITKVAGSLDRTWEGARRLKRRNVSVLLKFILMKQNCDETARMIEQADAGGFAYSLDPAITTRHDGNRSSLDTRMSPDQLEALYRGPLLPFVPRGAVEPTEAGFPCNCARGNCAISAQGDVYPCVSVPLRGGNVREQSFAEIWRSSPVFQSLRGLRLADYPSCAPCPHKAWCTRDKGAALLASGSYTGVDPWICRTAEIVHAVADELDGRA